MNAKIFFLVALIGVKLFSSETILSCSAVGFGKVTIEVTEDGYSTLKWAGFGKTSKCSLTLKQFENNSKAMVPALDFYWVRGRCSPELSVEENARILKQIRLILYTDSKVKERTHLQWSQIAQPAECKLDTFSKESVFEKAKRFKNGTWGK